MHCSRPCRRASQNVDGCKTVLIATDLILVETTEHIDWAIKQVTATGQGTSLQKAFDAARGVAGQTNSFLLGYSECRARGECDSFGQYILAAIDQQHTQQPTSALIRTAVASYGILLDGVQELLQSGSTFRTASTELDEQIKLRRQGYGSYKHDRQVAAEAQVAAFVSGIRSGEIRAVEAANPQAFFVTDSPILDGLEGCPQRICMTPEGLHQWLLSTKPLTPEAAGNVFDHLLLELMGSADGCSRRCRPTVGGAGGGARVTHDGPRDDDDTGTPAPRTPAPGGGASGGAGVTRDRLAWRARRPAPGGGCSARPRRASPPRGGTSRARSARDRGGAGRPARGAATAGRAGDVRRVLHERAGPQWRAGPAGPRRRDVWTTISGFGSVSPSSGAPNDSQAVSNSAFDPWTLVRDATVLTTPGVPSAVVTVTRSHTVVVSSSRNTGTSSDGHPVPPPRRWKVRETTSLSSGASSHSVQPYQARTLRPSTVVCFATGRGMTARTRRGNSARLLPPATSWWWPAPSWPASHQARQTDWILSVSNRPAGTTRRAQRPHAPAASSTRPAVATRTDAVSAGGASWRGPWTAAWTTRARRAAARAGGRMRAPKSGSGVRTVGDGISRRRAATAASWRLRRGTWPVWHAHTIVAVAASVRSAAWRLRHVIFPAVARQARDETCLHDARVHVVHQRQTDRTDDRTHRRRQSGLVHGA